MLCAATATAGDAFFLLRVRRTCSGSSTRGAGAKSLLRPRRTKIANASATSGEQSSTSTSSSKEYLDALQSLLREAREEGMYSPAAEGEKKEEEGKEEEEAPWSLSDSAAFLSAALGSSRFSPSPSPSPSSSSSGGVGGGGDDGNDLSVEESRELLLKTGWRRSRGGGRYQAREKATRNREEAAEGGEAKEAEEKEETTAATVAVPSPSSLSATLSALREHAGLQNAKEDNASPPSSLSRAVRRCPSLLALSPNQIALAAAFLRSLGLDASDVSAACSREPRLLGFGVAESMAPVASFLRSARVGMRAEDVARLAVSAPTVLGLSVERSLEPRVAFLERALSCPDPLSTSGSPSSTSGSPSSTSSTTSRLLAKALRSSPSLLHLNLKTAEGTLAELRRWLPDAAVRSRAIAAAPSMLLVGAEKAAATLDALARVASLGDDDDENGAGNDGENGAANEESGAGENDKEEARKRRTAAALVRKQPALLRHTFTGPEAVMIPAADWLARLLSCEAGATTPAVETTESDRKTPPPPLPPAVLLALPSSPTPEGRSLAAAAIRRCPAVLGRSVFGLEGNASWLAERARVFLIFSTSSSSSSSPPPLSESGSCSSSSAFDGSINQEETRGGRRSLRALNRNRNRNRTPLSLVAGVARRFPQVFGLSHANLDAKLKFLVDEVGMTEAEAGGIAASRMPQLLGLRLRSLRARAAFLFDGNDEDSDEEEEREGEEESRSEGQKPAFVAAVEGEKKREEDTRPIKGRRTPSEIARFAPCLASSLEKLVARHAAAAEAPRKRGNRRNNKMPALSSLVACTDEVFEGRLGLSAGFLEGLKSSRRVREAVERAERVAASKEEEEEEEPPV